jgi:molybdate transport system substrate-binding protein
MRITRVSALALAACAASIAAPHDALAADKTVLVVLAASSAKGAITDAVQAFEKKHPDVSVQPSYGGSSVIAAEITQGAAGDVVLLSEAKAKELGSALDDVNPIMRNHTTILVNKGAATKIHSPADLGASGVHLAGGTAGSNILGLSEKTVESLAKTYGSGFVAKYKANISTTKTDNAHLAAAVESGVADAAILFPSDLIPGKMVEVELPAAAQVAETHDIAMVKSSKNAAMARAFVDFLTSADGTAIIRAHHHDPAH